MGEKKRLKISEADPPAVTGQRPGGQENLPDQVPQDSGPKVSPSSLSPTASPLSRSKQTPQQIVSKLRLQLQDLDRQKAKKGTSFHGHEIVLGDSHQHGESHWVEEPGEELCCEPGPEEEEFFSVEECELVQSEGEEVCNVSSEIHSNLKDAIQESGGGFAEEELSEEELQEANSFEAADSIYSANVKVISTGDAVWDSWFPRGGMCQGTVMQWLAPAAGGGALHLIFHLAQRICQSDGLFVVIDPKRMVFPGSLLHSGFQLKQVLFVHPKDEAEQLWAWEQCLGDPAVSAVWTQSDQADSRYQRRWQLAARKGKAIGFLSRSLEMLGKPSWSDAQFLVQPVAGSHGKKRGVSPVRTAGEGVVDPESWELEVQALRCRGLFGKPKVRITLQNDILKFGQPGIGGVDNGDQDVMNRAFGN